jgi:hypothetical protein
MGKFAILVLCKLACVLLLCKLTIVYILDMLFGRDRSTSKNKLCSSYDHTGGMLEYNVPKDDVKVLAGKWWPS